MKVTRCSGEGQGSCKRCLAKGKCYRNWMCFLYEIEGYDGIYCLDCVNDIICAHSDTLTESNEEN